MNTAANTAVISADAAGGSATQHSEGVWAAAWRRFQADRVGLVSLIIVALFILLIVLPLVLIVGVGLPLLITVVALGAVAVALLGVSALIAAPVLVPVLLIVWLARRSRPKVAA